MKQVTVCSMATKSVNFVLHRFLVCHLSLFTMGQLWVPVSLCDIWFDTLISYVTVLNNYSFRTQSLCDNMSLSEFANVTDCM